jgi:hypothetical protein
VCGRPGEQYAQCNFVTKESFGGGSIIVWTLCVCVNFGVQCINERDVIIWDVLIAIISRNVSRKFLGWQSLIRHACQFKLQNVQRIIYQDLSGNKFATVFLAILRISAGVHERLSSIFVFCDRIRIKQKAILKT